MTPPATPPPASDSIAAPPPDSIAALQLGPDSIAAPPPAPDSIAVPLAAATIAAVLVFVGYLALPTRRTEQVVGRWADGTPTAAPPDDVTAPERDGTGPSTGAPTRLRIPAIGVDTPLVALHVGADGALSPPTDFGRAGWYADGTAPGDIGPSVVAGHVDSRDGPAVFYRLSELTPGDTVTVLRGGRTLRFTVTATARYGKRAFATRQVYGPTPDRQLRLITCGGAFDRSAASYKDNLVVYAVQK